MRCDESAASRTREGERRERERERENKGGREKGRADAGALVIGDCPVNCRPYAVALSDPGFVIGSGRSIDMSLNRLMRAGIRAIPARQSRVIPAIPGNPGITEEESLYGNPGITGAVL